MELRILKYFLMVAQEENITKAASLLHVTQPTLSRQLMQLEEELGVKLFYRSNHRIALTDEGLLLKRRAQEIIELTVRTEYEVSRKNGSLAGEIAIGCAEASNFAMMAEVMRTFRTNHPLVQYTVFSGIADDIKERIESGLLDIGFLTEPVNIDKYEFMRLPQKEEWGVLVKADSPLAAQENVTAKELLDVPLLIPQRNLVKSELASWFGKLYDKMDFAVTYTMLMNAAVMVRGGVGAALCLNMGSVYSDLAFVPLKPALKTGTVLVWKKSQRLTAVVEEFLSAAKLYISGISDDKI